MSEVTVVRLLRRSAMGAVFDAETKGTPVVLKRPVATVASRVVAAYQHLQPLHHPNLVKVLGVARDGDGPYVLLERIPRGTITSLLESVRRADEDVPAEIVLRMIEDIAAGLAALHSWNHPSGAQGYVHRDVSPSNVLLDSRGHFVLADLDLATPLHGAWSVIESAGKPGFRAPEQSADHAFPRSDVYALGALVAQVLSRGTLVAAEGAAAVLGDVLIERDDLSPGLVELIFEMIAEDRACRPTAEEVVSRARALLVEEARGADVAAYLQSFRPESVRPVAMPAKSPARDVPEWRVKGTAVVATIDYLIQQYGEEAYAGLMEFVSERAKRALADQVDGSAWYAGDVIVELTEAARCLHGDVRELASRIGAWSAEQALSVGGPYQVFRDKGLRKGVAEFIRATEDIYGLYYDTGRWVARIGDSTAVGLLEEVRYPRVMLDRVFAYLKRGMELVGARDVTLVETVDETQVRVDIRWTEP
ncbi:MAG: protein kinase [Myxococcota bacterium]